MDKTQTYITLNTNNKITQIGFGVFQIEGNELTEKSCLEALKIGYRHIDTAHAYHNEKGVGEAVKKSGIPRNEIFITSKIWANECEKGKTKKAIERMLKRLDMDYLDLLLIHWPFGDYVSAWKEMEECVKEGKIKNIGLSNFYGEHLEKILKNCNIKPCVNQVECHPYFPNDDLREKMKEFNCFIEAWSPIGRGDKKLLGEKILEEVGKKYNKTVVQILIRWHLQKGNIVLPRSINPQHIQENFNVFDFEISKDDMEKISSLKQGGEALFCKDLEGMIKRLAERKMSED